MVPDVSRQATISLPATDVPNGLLEVLGTKQFTPFGTSDPVEAAGVRPLIVITTNEERTLPAAFLRRCLVLQLRMPKRDAAIRMLVERGRAHFGSATDDAVLNAAARLLWDERDLADARADRTLPGQAEYLDLLRAVIHRHQIEAK